MTQMAAGALIFLRGDVQPARQTVFRSYSNEEVLETRRLPASEQPYFTPGFPLALPLTHAVRIQSLNGEPTVKFNATEESRMVSDTGELAWQTSPANVGLVTVDTPRTQALIGFLAANHPVLKNLNARIANTFGAIVLSSLDGEPLARSRKMLLSAGSRIANSGMKWNEAHTHLISQGGAPTLIEPIAGTVFLSNIEMANGVSVFPLDGAGKPAGAPAPAKKTGNGWAFTIGSPATTWYVVYVKR